MIDVSVLRVIFTPTSIGLEEEGIFYKLCLDFLFLSCSARKVKTILKLQVVNKIKPDELKFDCPVSFKVQNLAKNITELKIELKKKSIIIS